MTRARRVYCKVVACVEGETAIIEIVGGPGVAPESFRPHPCVRVSAELIPAKRRFPNSLVWFDVTDDGYVYVEPTDKANE